jgi:hypothetical protein
MSSFKYWNLWITFWMIILDDVTHIGILDSRISSRDFKWHYRVDVHIGKVDPICQFLRKPAAPDATGMWSWIRRPSMIPLVPITLDNHEVGTRLITSHWLSQILVACSPHRVLWFNWNYWKGIRLEIGNRSYVKYGMHRLSENRG